MLIDEDKGKELMVAISKKYGTMVNALVEIATMKREDLTIFDQDTKKRNVAKDALKSVGVEYE